MALILRISGPSNSGKSTLCMELTKAWTKQGRTVGYIKHSHHNPDLIANKDSSQLWTAGAQASLMVGADNFLLHQQNVERNLLEWLAFLQWDFDIILVEGWRKTTLPTILLSTNPLPPNWHLPSNITAVLDDAHASVLPKQSRISVNEIINNIEDIALKWKP